jgi:hypothetical protein
MIIKRIWWTARRDKTCFPPRKIVKVYEGWFLLGLLPLYIRQIKLKED